jgi:hypothetical protein
VTATCLPKGWGVLVPYRPGTPTYKLQVKTSGRACVHMQPHAPRCRTKATSLRWAPTLPRVQHLRTPPLSTRGLQRCHTSHGCRPCPASIVGSGVIACRSALDPAFLHKGGSEADMRPMALGGLWSMGIKNNPGYATRPADYKRCALVTKAPSIKAAILDLQDVRQAMH